MSEAQRLRSEGRKEGLTELLLRLIQRKFGVEPDAYRARVFAADPVTLMAWSEALLTARSVADLFDDPADPPPA